MHFIKKNLRICLVYGRKKPQRFKSISLFHTQVLVKRMHEYPAMFGHRVYNSPFFGSQAVVLIDIRL